MEEQQLSVMMLLQEAVLGELHADPDAIRRFLDGSSAMIVRDQASRKATNATCTAFCLYYLAAADVLAPAPGRGRFNVLLREEAALTLKSLADEIVRQHSKLGRKHTTTATGRLPNQYNSSIQLAGYLSASRNLNTEIPTVSLASFDEILNSLALRFLVRSRLGWVPRIENQDAPSAYLTFWTAAAIRERLHVSLPPTPKPEVLERCLLDVSRWSEQELTNGIAYHYTGFRSRVDVVELIYSVLCSMTFGRTPSVLSLCRQGLELLFANYFDHGCFAPSAPVLADKHNFSLQCPTAEALALLTALHPELLYNQWEALRTTYDWLNHNRIYEQGWIPESSGLKTSPTAFMTTSAITFLAAFARLLDQTMHLGASVILNVPRTSPSLPKGFTYPDKLAKILESHVIKPLKSIPRKEELASYSMILYGPPGTSKTTIARKIATDLGWPLHVINQNAFLQKGVANIDAEAERLFRLVGYLQDIVVLFDEVEELVEERSKTDKVSRMLTTAMLPRLHYLRDRHRIVFIFATNRLDSIDNAASRLGRFDIVHGVQPPNVLERESMIKQILQDLAVDKDVSDAFDEAKTAERAENFCYIDLFALARHVLIAKEIEGVPITADVVSEARHIYERRVKHEDFTKSLSLMNEHSGKIDRP